jgi:hypothetical protein
MKVTGRNLTIADEKCIYRWKDFTLTLNIGKDGDVYIRIRNAEHDFDKEAELQALKDIRDSFDE